MVAIILYAYVRRILYIHAHTVKVYRGPADDS